MCKDVVLGHAITSRKDELDWNLMAAETMGNTFVLYNFANVAATPSPGSKRASSTVTATRTRDQRALGGIKLKQNCSN